MSQDRDVAGDRRGFVTGGMPAFGRYAVIGDPVAHSRSPELHETWFRAAGLPARYEKLAVSREDLVRRGPALPFEFSGVNVTIPHKVAILGYVDRIDQTAREAGAANLLYRDEDRAWTAGNTDGDGFLLALEEATGEGALGKDVVILGAGGAARAIGVALRREGAGVTWVNRSLARAKALGPAAELRSDFLDRLEVSVDLLVNTLPPQADIADLDLGPLPDHAVVADVNYYDAAPVLLRRADELGLLAMDGRGMFLWQAALSFRRWTGREPDIDLGRRLLGME